MAHSTSARRFRPNLETMDDRIVPGRAAVDPPVTSAKVIAQANNAAGVHGAAVAPGQVKKAPTSSGSGTGSGTGGATGGASLSGYVFQDDNGDGIRQSAELVFGGVTVQLIGTDNLGNQVNVTVTTDGSGFYQFTNLAAGTYSIIEMTQPPVNVYGKTMLDGPNTLGSLGGSVQNYDAGDGVNPPVQDGFNSIVLAAGQTGTNYNFAKIEEVLN